MTRFEPDTTVRCTRCEREEVVRFADCLRKGWPGCCMRTMELVTSDVDVAGAVEEVMRDQSRQLERLLRGLGVGRAA